MESDVRTYLIDWLRSDPALSGNINAIEEESPVQASAPWVGIAASASTDWSHKSGVGREVRIALELVGRGDDASATGAMANAIEQRIATMIADDAPFCLVAAQFLRSRAERRPRGLRAILLEYRFRVLDRPSA